MSFRLERHESIPRGVKRVARQRLDKAISALAEADPGDAEIHNTRKHFKEVRAMLRLVRADLGTRVFDRENIALRDSGRALSEARDTKVLIDRLEALLPLFEAEVGPEAVAALRRTLVARHAKARACLYANNTTLARIVQHSHSARKRAKKWPLHRRGWKAIENGLRRTYGRGRGAMECVLCRATDEALHEWRKRTKDLRYELELVRDVCCPDMRLVDRTHHLTDLLGEDHDLVILRRVAAATLRNGARSAIATLIGDRRRALQRRCVSLGKEIYGRKTTRFVRELKRNGR